MIRCNREIPSENAIFFLSKIIKYRQILSITYIFLFCIKGDDSWTDNVIYEMHTCLQSSTITDKSDSCLYCGFFKKLYVELNKDRNFLKNLERKIS